jgi:transcriptional regulator with XRE-family HTH domain
MTTGSRITERIEKRGDEWCVVSKDGTTNLGCFKSEEDAKRRLQQVEFFKRQTESFGDEMIPAEWFRENCPDCYTTLKERGWKGVKISALVEQGFNQGLCAKFGAAEGFRTSCMADPPAGVTNAAAFCNALKEFCFGTTASARTAESITDTFEARLLEAPSKDGREWDIVIIEEGLSLNGNFYPGKVLRSAIPLFEGALVKGFELKRDFFDHLPEEIKAAIPTNDSHVVGTIRNIRERRTAEGKMALVGRFRTSDGIDWVPKMLMAQFNRGDGMLGFSIDATGRFEPAKVDGKTIRRILTIESVDSVDLVTRPAARGRFLRVVASIEEKDMKEAGAGTRIKSMREEKGWSVDQLAKAAGVEPSLIVAIESGESQGSPDVLAKIAKALGTDPANLTGEKKEPTAEEKAKAAEAAKTKEAEEAAAAKKKEEEAAAAAAAAAAAGTGDPPPQPTSTVPSPKPTSSSAGGDGPKEDPTMKKEMEDLKVELSEERVEAALGGSDLPDVSKDRIREMFKGKVVDRKKIREAIAKEKDYIAELAPANPIGSGAKPGVKVTEAQLDKWKKSMTAMLVSNPHEQDAHEDLKGVTPFVSLHESYRQITGFSGSAYEVGHRIMQSMAIALPGYGLEPIHEEKIKEHHKMLRESFGGWQAPLRETLQTTDWAEVFGDSVRRALIMAYSLKPLTDWKRVVSSIVPLQDFRTNRRIRVGGFADLATVGQLGTYQELVTPADEEVTYAAEKRGNIFSVSMESIVNDDLGKVRDLPRMMGLSAARTLFKFVTVTNLAANPTLDYDATPLFDAAHSNTAAVALAEASLNAAIIRMRKQTELSSAERIHQIIPRILMVPPDLERTAWELTNDRVKATSGEDSTLPNWFQQIRIEPFTNTFLTDVDNWFLIADPRLTPTIEIGFLGGRQEPEMFVQDAPNIGSVFTSDKITHKIRHTYGGDVLDHRGMDGSLV